MFRQVWLARGVVERIREYENILRNCGVELDDISFLYEENDGVFCQVSWWGVLPNTKHYIIDDIWYDRGRFVVSSDESMEHFREVMTCPLVCSNCGGEFFCGYCLSNGTVLCMSCHGSYVGVTNKLLGIELDLKTKFSGVGWGYVRERNMNCHKFLSCTMFHIENHGSMLGDEDRHVVTSIVKIMYDWDDMRVYPQSERHHGFLKWIDLTSNERYSSWVVGFFIENGGKVPLREPVLIGYIVEACRSYVEISSTELFSRRDKCLERTLHHHQEGDRYVTKGLTNPRTVL